MRDPRDDRSAPIRILCADDQPDNRALLEETLAGEGVEVVACASGDEALTRFSERPFDCVLLDVRMPGKDGFQTLRELRELPGGRDVPVIFLTALRDLDTFDRALAAGADFLSKPIRPVELAARVQTLLQLRRLSAEVREHHHEIARQRDAIMRLQLQKERLSAFLVHDLKSPISAMHAHAELLVRDRALSSGARDSARAIKDLCGRLNQLALNLLDLAKAEEGQLAPRRARVDLGALASQVREAFALLAAERSVCLSAEIAPDIELWGDGDMLRRMLENLVDNALRHSPADTLVSIEAETVDAHVELRIADQGRGIPDSLRESIFDRFVQLQEGTASSRGGRGLGLSFCRMTAEAHGGTIHVDPARSGAVFVVRLPIGSAAS